MYYMDSGVPLFNDRQVLGMQAMGTRVVSSHRTPNSAFRELHFDISSKIAQNTQLRCIQMELHIELQHNFFSLIIPIDKMLHIR